MRCYFCIGGFINGAPCRECGGTCIISCCEGSERHGQLLEPDDAHNTKIQEAEAAKDQAEEEVNEEWKFTTRQPPQ